VLTRLVELLAIRAILIVVPPNKRAPGRAYFEVRPRSLWDQQSHSIFGAFGWAILCAGCTILGFVIWFGAHLLLGGYPSTLTDILILAPALYALAGATVQGIRVVAAGIVMRLAPAGERAVYQDHTARTAKRFFMPSDLDLVVQMIATVAIVLIELRVYS